MWTDRWDKREAEQQGKKKLKRVCRLITGVGERIGKKGESCFFYQLIAGFFSFDHFKIQKSLPTYSPKEGDKRTDGK